ncbi:hypothetical protein V8G54_014913 [Vigna mungo]|uniref:Uncharacterized protein n=1 Tax=Vigna mungo TaxID=3915 RepID=A0AAQ3RZ00_VIGMU
MPRKTPLPQLQMNRIGFPYMLYMQWHLCIDSPTLLSLLSEGESLRCAEQTRPLQWSSVPLRSNKHQSFPPSFQPNSPLSSQDTQPHSVAWQCFQRLFRSLFRSRTLLPAQMLLLHQEHQRVR